MRRRGRRGKRERRGRRNEPTYCSFHDSCPWAHWFLLQRRQLLGVAMVTISVGKPLEIKS